MGLYKVIFLGLAVAGPDEEARLLNGLQKKFNLNPERAERLLQRVPIVVKKGLTRDEMEKYARAFREIGGKVKVEEEFEMLEGMQSTAYEPPTEPPSRPAPEPSPEPQEKPFMGTMVTCPQCGFEQPETDECMKCGVIISKFKQFEEMARAVEGQVREISSGESTPWESGEGMVSAFLKTVKESLFSPTRFFKKVGTGESYWAPLIYGVIVGIIGSFGGIFWQWLFFTHFFPIKGMFSLIPYSLILTVIIIAMPFMVAFSIWIGSAITHLCLMIVGGNRTGFRSTFRALAYSWSGNLFGLIPLIGGTIGAVYSLVLIILGVREVHGITTGKAVLAIFLPVIVAIGLGVLAVIFLGPMRFLGGVGV